MTAFHRLLSQLSVGWKIGLMSGLLVLSMLAVSGVSAVSMVLIGNEVRQLKDNVIPLIEDAERVSAAQLQQRVALERFLRHAAAADRAAGSDAVKGFEAAGEQAGARIAATVDKLRQLATADTAAAKTWSPLLATAQGVADAHASFGTHAAEMIRLATGGDAGKVASQAEKIEAEQDALRQRIDELGATLMRRGETATASIKAHEETMLSVIMVVAIVGTLFGVVAAIAIALGITRPLGRTVAALKALEDGDKSRDLEIVGRDEMATLSRTYESLRATLIANERRAAEQEAEKRRLEEENRQALLSLADNLESDVGSALGTMTSAIEQLTASSGSMSAVADETGRQAMAVSAAAEESSSNVQAVSAAAEELSASITEISRQVAESARIAGVANQKAERADERITGLAGSAEKIGSVVQLIQEIAEQTNLLALNATIEAARAGEAGKGFAVVAEEVKSLANQTAKATESISEHIGEVQGETRATVDAIQEITTSIQQIDSNTTTISAAVEEQGVATQEIARNVQQAAAGTQEVTQTIAGVSQAATETGSAASQVRSAADELSQQAALLNDKMRAFLREVRSNDADSRGDRGLPAAA